MRLSKPLFMWMFRQAFLAMGVALGIAVAYVLTWQEPLEPIDPWAGLFILFHGGLLTVRLGRFRSGGFAFLYTRGYTRDQLWGHMMLATLASILMVWLAASAVIWSGLRCSILDRAFQSPFFPVMAPLETAVPWAWLACYAVVLPLMHYAWVRQAQPFRGGSVGPLLVAGFVVAVFSIFNAGRLVTLSWWLIGVGGFSIAVAALWGGRRLHRRLEVRA